MPPAGGKLGAEGPLTASESTTAALPLKRSRPMGSSMWWRKTTLAVLATCMSFTVPAGVAAAAERRPEVDQRVADLVELQVQLRELLARHGVAAVEQEGYWSGLAGTGLRLNGEIVGEKTVKPDLISVQLDIRLEFEDGRMLIESFGGWAPTRQKAVDVALDNFKQNTFHVLLSAFGLTQNDEHAVQESWVVGGRPRKVTYGNVLIKSTEKQSRNAVGWFTSFEERLKAYPLPSGTHWVRVYYGQQASEVLGFEVMLDNKPWPEMQAEAAKFAWPTAEAFLSVRLFMVVQDEPESWLPPPNVKTKPWWRFW